MTAVGTHYKPSQWRGKRLVFQSIDPDEPKRETIKGVAWTIGMVLFAAILWFFSR
jgi:hypothetical protein